MEFHEHVSQAMKDLGLTEHDVADEFGCSLPTVRRWMSGQNAPHPVMQPHVIEWFKSKGYRPPR